MNPENEDIPSNAAAVATQETLHANIPSNAAAAATKETLHANIPSNAAAVATQETLRLRAASRHVNDLINAKVSPASLLAAKVFPACQHGPESCKTNRKNAEELQGDRNYYPFGTVGECCTNCWCEGVSCKSELKHTCFCGRSKLCSSCFEDPTTWSSSFGMDRMCDICLKMTCEECEDEAAGEYGDNISICEICDTTMCRDTCAVQIKRGMKNWSFTSEFVCINCCNDYEEECNNKTTEESMALLKGLLSKKHPWQQDYEEE